MAGAFEHRTIALAECRQINELAEMFVKEGAEPLRYPLIAIHDSPDIAAVHDWVQQFVAGAFDTAIFLTGEGIRRLAHFAEEGGQRVEFLLALGKIRTVVRGPKPAQVMKEYNLKPTLIASAPTTDGVVATLRTLELASKTVGVQWYAEPVPVLVDYLASVNAKLVPVLPYAYAPAAETAQVVDLIDRLASASIDLIVFTSTPQIHRLYEVAEGAGKLAEVESGLKKTCVAAVGPIIAESIRQKGIAVDIVPPQGWVMKNLVQQIKRELDAKRPR